MPDEVALYEAVGGMAFFESLVDRFYERVASDPELLRVYPHPDDLGPARRRLTLFLAQYWGGPATYSAERGDPRIRMRHFASRSVEPSATAGSSTCAPPSRNSIPLPRSLMHCSSTSTWEPERSETGTDDCLHEVGL